MVERDRVLITCQHVWASEADVTRQLESVGLEVDIPRFEGQQLGEQQLIPIIGEYVGVIAGDDHFTRRVLESAARLRVLSKWGVGVDAIDLDACAELGIEVFNTPGVFGEELADYAMGYIHLLARRQHEVNQKVKEGTWHKVRGTSLAGKTLGIVGLGSSGRALARRAAASSMRVIAVDAVPPPDGYDECEIVELDSLLAAADVVSLHLPASVDTRHLINADALNSMKRGAWIINTSRGALVDEKALVAALEDGRIGAAALDVFEEEPVSVTNALLSMDNVIVGSHNGSNTFEAIGRTTDLAVANLIAGLGLGESA